MTIFNGHGVRYAIVGGIAVIQHTRSRTTNDIDAMLTVPQVLLPGLLEALESRGFAVDLQVNIREFVTDGFTSLRFNDVIVDLMRPVIPAYTAILDRAVTVSILGHQVKIGSPEDLIVMKLIAMRPQDQTDIQDLIMAYGSDLDLDFIRTQLDTFSPPDDPRRQQLETWVRQSANRQPRG